MICSHRKFLPVVLLFGANILFGCGGGSGSGTTMPATPTFTSTPVTAAEEGMMYSYQVTATSSDMSAITYELSGGPAGATISGNTVTWTPTHTESRVRNAFTVKATTASGGNATQTWNVTPNGTVNITAVTTYWTSNGPMNVPRLWLPNIPFPAALVPQPDGSLQSIPGVQNADSSFSIPNVPGGFYWLALSQGGMFWTSTSDFDAGNNVVGGRVSATNTQATTTFNYAISGLVPAPPGDFVMTFTDAGNLNLLPGILQPTSNSTTVSSSVSIPSLIDWSSIKTLYYVEYDSLNSGGFQGIVMGPEFTQTDVSLVNGGTNNLTATLNPSPTSTLSLSIKGSEWANAMQGIGPGAVTPLFSDYAVVVQPYLTNGFVPVPLDTPPLGSFALLQPEQGPGLIEPGLFCSNIAFPPNGGGLQFGVQPIVTDVDFGTLSYGDPFPADWPRLFQYCQVATVSVPVPNSSVPTTFAIVNREIAPLPTGPVSPILTAVQNPTLNGNSLFAAANLTTTTVTLSWSPPATGQPYGYYVRVYAPVARLPGSALTYDEVAQYGTTKTSMQVPFLAAGSTYVFVISAELDANANMEKSPGRTKAPSAEASVVSAPIVIAAGATAAVSR